MTEFQRIWWEQAKSDYRVFLLLRRQGAPPCHLLHYLQMLTEKLAKAYFWRWDTPPPRSHKGFVQFLRLLGQIPESERGRIAKLFSFRRYANFRAWITANLPIAYELEQLSPDLANDGANPEYPWPHAQPRIAPVNHEFPIWIRILSRQGRDLMRVIHIAVHRFPEYATT